MESVGMDDYDLDALQGQRTYSVYSIRKVEYQDRTMLHEHDSHRILELHMTHCSVQLGSVPQVDSGSV